MYQLQSREARCIDRQIDRMWGSDGETHTDAQRERKRDRQVVDNSNMEG